MYRSVAFDTQASEGTAWNGKNPHALAKWHVNSR